MIYHEHSKIFTKQMDERTRFSALRFMLSMPLGQWFGISALPNYVFEYIYEVGTLIDLPWIRFRDDDTGQRIRREQMTENPVELSRMLKGSRLFKRLRMDELIRMAYHEQLSVDGFERFLLKYLKQHKK